MSRVRELLNRFGWYCCNTTAKGMVEAMYMSWLYGVSTRQLARLLGCDKNTVINTLERVYGHTAVNRSAKSLLISLAEDYPDCLITEEFVRNNLLLVERLDGEVRASYTSTYPGGKVIHKELRVPKYQQHRSNQQLQHISNAEARDNIALELLTEEEYKG